MSIFLLDYFGIELGIIPREITWLPDILSMVAFLAVLAATVSGFHTRVPPRYKAYIGAFIFIGVVGVILNTVSAGPMITGIRNYFKYLPFFLLPFAYHFTSRDLKWQLKWLVPLIAIQVPLAVYQRLVLYPTQYDLVSGTVGISSLLTILLVCTITLLVSLYVKKELSLKAMLIACAYLSIPTMLNETKSSLVFLPLAFLLPFFLASGNEKKLGQLMAVGAAVVGVMIAFVAVYDYFIMDQWGYGILDFVTTEGRMEKYLYKGVQPGEEFDEIGRVDGYFLALSILSEDPVKLLFGLGIGNVSNSFLGGLDGEYWSQYARFGIQTTTVSYLLWEIGVLGLLLHFWVLWPIFKDARYLSTTDGRWGALGLGWMVVTIFIFIALGYKRFLFANLMGYLFWFYSGVVIVYAQRLRLLRKKQRQNRESEGV